jgi:hypothetical protein
LISEETKRQVAGEDGEEVEYPVQSMSGSSPAVFMVRAARPAERQGQ